MKLFQIFSLIILSILLNSCASGVKSRNLLFRSNEFAIYTVNRDKINLKSESSVPKILAHPLEISEDKILDLLGNIRFREESSYGDVNQYIFEEKEIKEFAMDLADGLQKLKPDQILLVISKYNPVKSVVSHYSRTGFYIWSSDTSIEILFGELQKEITYDEQGNYYDWSNIPDIPFEHFPASTYVLQGPGFSFKKVSGFRNKHWLVFDKADLAKLKFEKRKKTTVPEITNSVDADLKSEKRISRDEEDGIINGD
ncbi:LA_1326/LA_4305 family lipoprotein [Leptospira meyeri]|uniref:LA_1326/LA_4305 family lipoprotein n=1 Tax=Leptospira meyeri TaxID=29508 RepID=UPI000C29B548|nr:hypothetical protein [Leptospira meyeri]PKA25288.1 hypothetical protein CH381_16160 [Leptospira sp. mixed culture ATI2-C-A1]MCW7489419.1 hypothetical protein [Leptospira meyeri]PKA12284.1 hypothetical protein CH372_09880 [Leptospira meyeri]TGL12846.1 hypothetical protein EHQ50_13830 [Leptospira meyeri]TGM23802.1 hypothetical protein EHQ73_01820 [Leptospira meyeri]